MKIPVYFLILFACCDLFALDEAAYRDLRARANVAYRSSGDLVEIKDEWEVYYAFVGEFEVEDIESMKNAYLDPSFDLLMLRMRLMNIYIHLGRIRDAESMLLESVSNPLNFFNFSMHGLTNQEKALLQVHMWRYIEDGLGTPPWEDTAIEKKLLEIVRSL